MPALKMLPQFIKYGFEIMTCIRALVFTASLLCLFNAAPAVNGNSEGQACTIQLGVYGKCALPKDCPDLQMRMNQLGLGAQDVGRCGYNTYDEVICCPNGKPIAVDGIFNTTQAFLNKTRNSDDDRSATPFSTNPANPKERKAIQACRAIESIWEPRTRPLIIGGAPVAPGEYPHMAAIGYTTLEGKQGPPYDFRCGGALIDKRFVLTAAHCVNRRDLFPAIVRLGATDFADSEQLKDGIDASVEAVHLHPNYNSLEKHDDIALIELKEDIKYTSLVLPACLYTEVPDPAASAELNVTGWGITNLKTRQRSDILLQARVQIVPISRCNASFISEGILPKGIVNTQMCTQDPKLISDACWGDSGGPLNLIVNAALPMRIIGVISAGSGCASVTPSLYTRVAAYLDFIERIVWP